MITDRETASPVGHGEERGISPGAHLRQTGLLAMAAGASTFLTPILHPDDPGNAAWVPVHLLAFATLIAVLLVLVGIFVRQLPRSECLGLAGFLAAFVGTSMMLMEGREHLFSHDFGQGTPVGLWQLIATSLVFSVGYILLGVAIFRAGILPRGAGVLLAVGGGPIVAFSPPIGILAVLVVGHTLFGAGLAWLGYALFFSPTGAARRNVGRQTAADAAIR
jgi:hypothetical protein